MIPIKPAVVVPIAKNPNEAISIANIIRMTRLPKNRSARIPAKTAAMGRVKEP